ncbi:MAG: bifunctional UDP-N-acetylglucosamine diphosphorylase/glucosamine-1-phosphate N-acetyltransferase GlmU [Candidatus Wallbacteria bacterium]|nr:bifunctional UDP-N-acetylglucosamine diphosphorylase/glucosamine-1-phosphate N-acetyltransferase GlmU [Candidatus Wallbacteria bacterium]
MQAIVLAAGKSTRMKSALSKLTFNLLGKRVVDYVYQAVSGLGTEKTVFVLGPHNFELELPPQVLRARQEQPLGTGHAVLCALQSGCLSKGEILILPGDIPLITADSLKIFVDCHRREQADLSVLSTELPDAGSYGRIIRDKNGFHSIVEARDATDRQKKIREINTGIYLISLELLLQVIDRIGTDNAQHEFYLTDIVNLCRKERKKACAFNLPDSADFIGVNTPLELAEALRELKIRKNLQLSASGVIVLDPDTTYVDWDVQIGTGTVIMPGTVISGDTVIGEYNQIGPYTQIQSSRIGNRNQVQFSIVNGSVVSSDCQVGPFAHIRPGSRLEDTCKVGNFVELKKTRFSPGVKASHLSYIGDADVGVDTNIGAGTITCNYDGIRKNETKIGEHAFIGSNSSLVAPVTIGAHAYVGAGSVITKDVPPYALGLGREKQVNIEDWVRKKEKAKD